MKTITEEAARKLACHRLPTTSCKASSCMAWQGIQQEEKVIIDAEEKIPDGWKIVRPIIKEQGGALPPKRRYEIRKTINIQEGYCRLLEEK